MRYLLFLAITLAILNASPALAIYYSDSLDNSPRYPSTHTSQLGTIHFKSKISQYSESYSSSMPFSPEQMHSLTKTNIAPQQQRFKVTPSRKFTKTYDRYNNFNSVRIY
jgi:hypothetical protein